MKTRREAIAVEALKASIRFSAECVSICELNPRIISHLNRTATIRNLEKNIEAMQQFIDLLKAGM